MARFPSINDQGQFEAPEVRDSIKTLVTREDLGITVDTSVGTRVFVGDTMIHGTIGPRNIESLLDPAWDVTVAGRQALLYRVGNTVYFEARINRVSDGGSRGSITPVASIPIGFRPMSEYTVLGLTAVGRDSGTLSTEAVTSAVSRGLDGTWSEGDTMTISAQWQTNSDWPTSLPGIPA